MYSTSSSPYADRSQDKSYKRTNFSHSQSALNFSALGGNNTTSQPPLAAASQLPNSWSTSFNPQNSLAASTRDGSGYLPGYLLSASQGMPLPEGSQRYEDPPLLPSKNSPYGNISPGTFGAENGDQHMSRQQPLDEDAPPTQSLLDEINTIPMGGDPFKTPIRNQRHQRSNTTKEWHEVIVFGFPKDKLQAAAKLFSSLGDSQEPQPGPEGANWFKIAYKHEWEAARAVRKNVNAIGRPVALEPSSSAYKAHPGGLASAGTGEDWASAHSANNKPENSTGMRSTGLFGLIGW
ncbi:hypothetical protein M408DRAFT_13877 [Serendipita vermifera MAFF 305830]|uniref:RRM Nup35-type domain-containing protein n=1 Tax=Serendipita vermifera MAFF 305830 TaxID=933852 RepID=A0A0C3BSH3_SERVB|nr:hypothetical protein M408DRAFT_13877 [Serendipita vermifera MAFF 305830]